MKVKRRVIQTIFCSSVCVSAVLAFGAAGLSVEPEQRESLTLVDVEEGVAQPAGEDRFGQVPEVLLHQVSHVEGGLVVEGDAVRVRLHPLTEELDPGLHTGLPEQTHLVRHRTLAGGEKSSCVDRTAGD